MTLPEAALPPYAATGDAEQFWHQMGAQVNTIVDAKLAAHLVEVKGYFDEVKALLIPADRAFRRDEGNMRSEDPQRSPKSPPASQDVSTPTEETPTEERKTVLTKKDTNFMAKFAGDEIFGSKSKQRPKKLSSEIVYHKWPHRLLLTPQGPSRMTWDLVGVILVVTTAISLPYLTAFISEPGIGWEVFNFLTDIFFLCDIIVNMRTAYIDDGQTITDSKAIILNYLKGWFFLDIISSFPFDWVVAGVPFVNAKDENSDEDENSFTGLFSLLRIVKALRLLRLLRLVRFFRYFSRFEDALSLSSQTIWILKLGGLMLMFSHWNACIQFLVPRLEQFPADSWVVRSEIDGMHPAVQYTYSFYNAMSQMLSIGPGTVEPQRTLEIWCVLLSMVVGANMYGLFVASLAAMVTSSDMSHREYRGMLDMANQYMHHMQLPKELRQRVRCYYELMYPDKRCYNETHFLESLSDSLMEDIKLNKCHTVLATLKVVQGGGEPGLAGAISRALERVVFVDGDYIIREGEAASAMFFVSRGAVEVVHDYSKESIACLGPSSFFGEMALISKHGRSLASVKVIDYCEGYKLTREAYNILVDNHPSFKQYLESVAMMRLQGGKKFGKKKIGRKEEMDDSQTEADDVQTMIDKEHIKSLGSSFGHMLGNGISSDPCASTSPPPSAGRATPSPPAFKFSEADLSA